LRQDQVDIYALQPTGPFAAETHKQIHQLLRDQVAEKAVIVSIPGLLAGMTTLSKGHETAVVQPEIRGMCSWSVDELLKSVAKPEEPDPEKLKEEIKNFLQRLYYELRNLGAAPQERAVNYVASNVHQVTKVCQYALQEHLKLDRIAVERSALGRPGSECWDVVTTLFDPARRFERGKEVFRLTVDVSEVLPVTIGDMQHWSVY
jgi:cyanobactin maturation PatA/PatG family protease